MPKKSKTNEQFVTSKEFNERFDKVDKRFDEIENKMATKDDLKNFATKDDIKNMATKDDIERLDKKIDATAMRLSKEIIKNSEAIENLKATVATKDDIERIITTIDIFASKTEDHERKAIMNTHRIKEVESN